MSIKTDFKVNDIMRQCYRVHISASTQSTKSGDLPSTVGKSSNLNVVLSVVAVLLLLHCYILMLSLLGASAFAIRRCCDGVKAITQHVSDDMVTVEMPFICR